MDIHEVDFLKKMEGNVWNIEKIDLVFKEISKRFFWNFKFLPEPDLMLIRVNRKFLKVFSELMRPKELHSFEIRYILSMRGIEPAALKMPDGSFINVTNGFLDSKIQGKKNCKINNEPVMILEISTNSLNHLCKLKQVSSLIIKLRNFAINLEKDKDIKGISLYKIPFQECSKPNKFCSDVDSGTILRSFYPNIIRFEKKSFMEKRAAMPVYVKKIVLRKNLVRINTRARE